MATGTASVGAALSAADLGLVYMMEKAWAKKADVSELPENKTYESEAERTIREQFKAWSLKDTHMTIIGGKSLKDKIVKLKHKHKTGKVTPKQLQELKSIYLPASSVSAQLTVKDPTETFRPEMLVAIDAMLDTTTTKRTTSGILSFLKSCGVDTWNQREMVALCRVSLDKQGGAPQQVMFILAAAACVHRCQLNTKFPKEFGCIRMIIDNVLAH